MGRKIRRFTVRECAVCGYKFSDNHHTYPRHRGGNHSSLIPLCPNHHRYAHMIYQMVDAGATDEYIIQFGQEFFDTAFNVQLLDDLLTDYRQTEAAMELAYGGLVRWLVGVVDSEHLGM